MASNPNLVALYRQYKKSAKKRGHEFDLSLEWFSEIIQHDCYLCGSPPSNRYVHDSRKPGSRNNPLIYNGIDRIDNSIGYVPGNLSCSCGHCNMAKKKMSVEEFLSHIKKVYEFNFPLAISSNSSTISSNEGEAKDEETTEV